MARPKLLFVGLDSAEPTLLKHWAGSGELPGFAALFAQGATAEVAVPEGFANGCAWPSLYTGLNPGRHGRYSSATWSRGSYDYGVRFDEDRHLCADPFWVHLCQQGISVGIVDMVRAPLTEGLRGFQISDWLTHDRRDAKVRSYPGHLAEEIVQRYGDDMLGGTPERFLERHDYPQLRDALLGRIKAKTRQTLDFANRFTWDLYMTVFGEAHDAGHIFWRFHDRNHPGYDADMATRIGDPIKQVYAALESAVLETLSRVDADYRMLFAGPGMGPNHSANNGLSAILRDIEEEMFGRPQSEDTRGPSFRSVVRSIVPLFIRPSLRKVVPRALKTAWDAGDMGRHRFFQIPHTGYSGAIRINLRGREPDGCVEPGEEYDRLCGDLEDRLTDLINCETNAPVVSKTVRVHHRCSGSALDQLPDLLVVWNRAAPIRNVSLHGLGEYQIFAPTRSGDHTSNAVMWITGPGIPSGTLREGVCVEDLAPTMSQLLQFESATLDGQPIRELLK